MEETRYAIPDLSELEHKLIINALKIWRGDFGEDFKTSQIWYREIDALLKKVGFGEKGWKESN